MFVFVENVDVGKISLRLIDFSIWLMIEGGWFEEVCM